MVLNPGIQGFATGQVVPEFTSLYDWPLQREQMKRAGSAIPAESMNMQLFRNIVDYFH